jgi:3'-5' exoribonuclease-like protein
MSHIMLDLETLGTTPGSIIVSIGAVSMDFVDGRIVDTFYRNIDAVNAQSHGLTIDAATVSWWLQQSEHARTRLADAPVRLPTALLDFSTWLGGACETLWGDGSDFDNVLLKAAYNACNLPLPWTYRASRDYRTIKNLFPDPALRPPDNAHGHDALADATWQGQHLINILRAISPSLEMRP